MVSHCASETKSVFWIQSECFLWKCDYWNKLRFKFLNDRYVKIRELALFKGNVQNTHFATFEHEQKEALNVFVYERILSCSSWIYSFRIRNMSSFKMQVLLSAKNKINTLCVCYGYWCESDIVVRYCRLPKQAQLLKTKLISKNWQRNEVHCCLKW